MIEILERRLARRFSQKWLGMPAEWRSTLLDWALVPEALKFLHSKYGEPCPFDSAILILRTFCDFRTFKGDLRTREPILMESTLIATD